MTARKLSLTTVGLSLHDDSLVKSFLGIISGKTQAEWRHTEGVDVDVAICNPDNALSELLRTREEKSGRPLCTALLTAGEHSTTWSRVLRRPMRVREFMNALETLTSEIEQPKALANQSTLRRCSIFEPHPDSALAVLKSLHDSSNDRPRSIAIRTGDITVIAAMSKRRCYSAKGFGDDVLATLAGADALMTVDAQANNSLGEDQIQTNWMWLDAMLWTVGSRAAGQALLGEPKPREAFQLKRWPDFGRIPSNPTHIKLTALLIKKAHTIQELSDAVALGSEDILRFLRSAACCGILETTSASASPPIPASVAELKRGMFDVLRVALGMRA